MRHQDASVAAEAGAAYLGVILAPGGKRTVTLEEAAGVFSALDVQRVGVFVDAEFEPVLHAARYLRLDVLQLHGDESPGMARQLREAGPWRVWKAIRVREVGDYLRANRDFTGAADGLLLDGWHPQAHGGTGSAFPWEQVGRHRAKLSGSLSLIAAGGLRPDNVARAVQLLAPSVVDVSSGVEIAPGIKDAHAVRAFVAAAAQAMDI